MVQSYPVPAGRSEAETVVRKSRFIARATKVTTRSAALSELELARADFPDARHHCFAYIIGKPGAATNAAMSDDGEPSGTAGKPILNVLDHKGIGDVMVIVIRYFGGIKLGAGGLVRAYAGATEKVLSQMELVEHAPVSECALRLDFPQEQAVRHWADQHGASVESVAYSTAVTMTLCVPDVIVSGLREFCAASGIEVRSCFPGQGGQRSDDCR